MADHIYIDKDIVLSERVPLELGEIPHHRLKQARKSNFLNSYCRTCNTNHHCLNGTLTISQQVLLNFLPLLTLPGCKLSCE